MDCWRALKSQNSVLRRLLSSGWGLLYRQAELSYSLPNFVVNPAVPVYLQRSNLVQDFWLVEADKIVDYHIRSPEELQTNLAAHRLLSLLVTEIQINLSKICKSGNYI